MKGIYNVTKTDVFPSSWNKELARLFILLLPFTTGWLGNSLNLSELLIPCGKYSQPLGLFPERTEFACQFLRLRLPGGCLHCLMPALQCWGLGGRGEPRVSHVPSGAHILVCGFSASCQSARRLGKSLPCEEDPSGKGLGPHTALDLPGPVNLEITGRRVEFKVTA